jgi:mRNA-degrading endonuclease toxin of MazEF toxin-antitoxin module
MLIKRGRIIWARFVRGQCKKRPAVVISDSYPDGSFFVAVGTTQRTLPLPDHQVDLPWSRPSHPKTKLHTPTAIDCRWIEKLDPGAVEEVGGFVPDRILVQIIENAGPLLP